MNTDKLLNSRLLVQGWTGTIQDHDSKVIMPQVDILVFNFEGHIKSQILIHRVVNRMNHVDNHSGFW